MLREQSEYNKRQVSQDESKFRCRARASLTCLASYRKKYTESAENLGANRAGLHQSVPARIRAEAGATLLCPDMIEIHIARSRDQSAHI
jgi:hypothetical protein